MRTLVLLLVLFSVKMQAQNLTIFESFSQLEKRLNSESDTVFVVNFWATWCKPCVEEMPFFTKLDSAFHQRPMKLILVSLDFKKMAETKVAPFLKNRQIMAETILLADADANSWISKVDPKWDGAIPATLVLKKEKREFHRVQFEKYEQLASIVESFVQN